MSFSPVQSSSQPKERLSVPENEFVEAQETEKKVSENELAEAQVSNNNASIAPELTVGLSSSSLVSALGHFSCHWYGHAI
jgi:hypothetical protein